MRCSFRVVFVLVVLNAAVGCGDSRRRGGEDGGAPADLATADARLAPVDESGGLAKSARFVVTRFDEPRGVNEFAYDLDGDGRNDNQVGQIRATLSSNALGSNVLSARVDSGQLVELIAHFGNDAALTNDAVARSVWKRGSSIGIAPPPGLTFALDSSIASAILEGATKSGAFESTATARATAMATMPFVLPLGTGAAVTLVGAHVKYQVSTTGIMSGELHGAIRAEDVSSVVVPSIAQSFRSYLMTNPSTSTSQTIRTLFDVGGCAGATAGDGQIADCEVANSATLKDQLKPDVDLFDANGGWAPRGDGVKDALSVGVGFVAAPANWQ